MTAGSDGDAVDFDFGEALAVAVLFTVAFAALLFKDDHFVAFNMIQHSCADFGVVQHRLAHGNGPVIFEQENLVESEVVARIGFKLVDEELLPFLDFELLTSYRYDCEHDE